MPVDHTEKGFERAVEAYLIDHGYMKAAPAAIDAKTAIDAATLVAFLKDSQPKEWEKLAAIYGNEVEAKVVGTVVRDLDLRGMLDCLRHGVKDRGVTLRLAYFKPATGLNPETLALYAKNVLTVYRQVHHSQKEPHLSVDVVLGVNGLPVATAELKNPFTGQSVADAIRQYREDRDPKETLLAFKRRALVHFAVDPDLVFMTTKLAGKDTVFLPFNRGRNGGKGNPDNPASGWKTAYLWEEVWARDSWLDVLARFVHLEVREEKREGKIVRKEAMIFPRYHQLDAVRRLLAAARSDGSGTNYLIQHSAGSGKSNTIAWLAHRLSNLHDSADAPVFDSVIVITDRRILDRQLQDTIYQFEHKQGVVNRIDDNSQQLADAITAGGRVIITTLQKFSFVLDKISALPKRRYAVIADEAHSSQSGESAASMRRVLAGLEEAEKQEGGADPTINEVEEEIAKAIAARGPQKNVSFFAFTATPKHKTLELFGHDGPDGKPRPFHLYSMRQAIEEGFILDVLRNYTTYKSYYKLTKAVEDDPEVDRKKAVQAVAKFVSLHPHNLAQKTQVMVEHFRSVTRKKIGGRGKAMLVTRSRLHAVRYKQAFDKYLAERGFADTRVLVAFSGTVTDENGNEFTEPQMNGFGEKELPARFGTDQYHVLIVAEKYQTGFDQPLLHTMYVDRKLDGLQAVQTLSRLNRTCAGKEDSFVLDFVNDAEEIKDAFRPYYEATAVEERVDPNLLYVLKHKLDTFQVYWQQEVEDFANVFFKPPEKQREQDKGLLHKHVDPAVGRFENETDERRADFRHQLGTYLRLYAFLSQMVSFQDPDLEKLYAYGRLLLSKLPGDGGGSLKLDDEVKLSYYRLAKTHEGSAALTAGEGATVSGPTDVGTGRPKDEDVAKLSEIVEVLNEKFGTDFGPEDQLLFDQVIGDLAKDVQLADQARTNTLENFRLAFDPRAVEAFVARMERNSDISSKFMSDEQLRDVAIRLMAERVFTQVQAVSGV